MHMEEAASQGLPLSYVLLDLDAPPNVGLELSQVIDAAERDGFAGVNVTYPFKQAVIPLLDDLSQDARRLGAANTVVFRNGRRTGHNTDWSGFAESFRRGLKDAPLARAVQVGAGGAGAAVAYALLVRGVGKLQLFDLDRDRARELVANLKALFGEARAEVGTDIAAAMATADGLANATPVGMTKYPGTPIPVALLRPTQWVAEVVYFPLETELLAAARALGCRTLDGGGMAVFQAAEAFRLFTGVTPDTERMRAWFLAAVDRSAPVAADLHD
jgi:shikimate dehydrogenase